MQTTYKRFAMFFLAFLLIVTLAQPAVAEQRLIDDIEHIEIAFADMPYYRYDFDAFGAKVDKLRDLMQVAGNDEEILALYDELLYESEVISTMSSLATIGYYSDTGNKYWQEERTFNNENSNDILDSFETEISNLLDSEYEKTLIQHIGRDNAELFRNYNGMTDEQRDLFAKDLELELRYYELEGMYTPYSNEYYNALGENYLEFLQNRTKLAKSYGFDTFDSFANAAYYYRDYDYNETKQLFESVRKHILPLYNKLRNNYSTEYEHIVSEYSPLAIDDMVAITGKYISEISPELAIPWEYMIRNNLYDIEPSDSKANIGFTITLPMYKSAFIMNSPVGGFYDMQTLVHEFGHFTQAYYDATPSIYQTPVLDLCEVHSQGLEALFTHYYPEIYGENSDAFIHELIIDFLRVIIDYSYIAEFETEAYRLDNPDFNQLKKLGTEIGRQYWPRASREALSTYWIAFPHTHTAPMYSTSYVVSALASLDLWVQSLVDKNAATDSYLKLVSLHSTQYFGNALQMSGISNIFKRATIDLLCDNIATVLLEGGKPKDVVPGVPQDYSRLRPKNTAKDSVIPGLPQEMDTTITVAITIAIVVMCIVIVVRSRRKEDD